jgi:hypothetical protein
METDAYDALAKAVHAAGFFTNGVETYGSWHRTCVCAKKRPEGGYAGNSFWVSRTNSGWYLGAWGGFVYRLADESRLAELCITWLSRCPDGTGSDFDDVLKAGFGLIAVDDQEFDRNVDS